MALNSKTLVEMLYSTIGYASDAVINPVSIVLNFSRKERGVKEGQPL